MAANTISEQCDITIELSAAVPGERNKSSWGIRQDVYRLDEAWRLLVHGPENDGLFAMGFERQRDAELARAALIRDGLGTHAALERLWLDVGPKEFVERINRIMTEAMQW